MPFRGHGVKFQHYDVLHTVTGTGPSHADSLIASPPNDEDWHIDRIIASMSGIGAGNDECNKVRLYTMPGDLSASDLSASFPDDNDPNVWFRQLIYGSNPIYPSWRPRRTVKGGDILYLDTVNQTFQAAHEIKIYLQTWWHEV